MVPGEYDTWCYGLNLLFDTFSTDIGISASDYDSDDNAYKISLIPHAYEEVMESSQYSFCRILVSSQKVNIYFFIRIHKVLTGYIRGMTGYVRCFEHFSCQNQNRSKGGGQNSLSVTTVFLCVFFLSLLPKLT